MDCPDCDGEGRVPVTYSEARVPIAGNEQAERWAGMVHHYEDCETCGGEGEIEEDE